MKSKLILIPTPIDETLPLEPVARELLLENSLKEDFCILVEEHKVARQRWIKWGLPREAIDRFILMNEHTQSDVHEAVLRDLKANKTVVLMSDGGLPAFCDPGQRLVQACHENGIEVTSTPFPNSIALSLALSGIDHSRFTFAGFLSTDQNKRKTEMDKLAERGETIVIMDTPYRLGALVSDLGKSKLKNRIFFLASNLNSTQEKLFYGRFGELEKFSDSLHKPEFVLVISGA